eukprot:Nk52_evm58s62 gene=Nk52_evmTU58s62
MSSLFGALRTSTFQGIKSSTLLSSSRAFSSSSAMSQIKNVTVVGAGLMGAGIAHVSAQSGHKVVVVDTSDKALENGKNIVLKSLKRITNKKFGEGSEEGKKAIDSVMGNLSWTTSVEDGAKDSDLIVEAIIENMKIKKDLFSKLDKLAPASCIFASNTSSLIIGEIATATERRDNFAGLHFFNPVPMMKLVEVIKTDDTNETTYKSLMDFCKRIGKTPITCKDTPGFVVNRLLVPNLAEAIRMVERGDCTKEDVDIGMKLGAGHPMGPFELADYVGLDTTKHILDGWSEKYPDVQLFRPIPMLNKLVEEGKLGMKSGEGFYNYKKK